jgi:predicted RNase H-like HicB family nuclease
LISSKITDIVQLSTETILKLKELVDIMRQVIIYPGEDGWWVAECPSLPGCISQGESRERAVANIKEALKGDVKELERDGLPCRTKGLKK